MTEEVGGNPENLRGKARNAGQLADAMVGLKKTFINLVEAAENAACEPECKKGYPKFQDRYEDDVKSVEEHGLQLAENIDATGAEIGRNDAETEEKFSDAWPGLDRPINQGSSNPEAPGGKRIY